MDQYPYSIPPAYQYPENAPDKNSNISGESAGQTANPFYMNTGAPDPGFGFAPQPGPLPQDQILPLVPPVQANGLMPASVNYGSYGGAQFSSQPVPEVSPLTAAMGLQGMYNQQGYMQAANVDMPPMDYSVHPLPVPVPLTIAPVQMEPPVAPAGVPIAAVDALSFSSNLGAPSAERAEHVPTVAIPPPIDSVPIPTEPCIPPVIPPQNTSPTLEGVSVPVDIQSGSVNYEPVLATESFAAEAIAEPSEITSASIEPTVAASITAPAIEKVVPIDSATSIVRASSTVDNLQDLPSVASVTDPGVDLPYQPSVDLVYQPAEELPNQSSLNTATQPAVDLVYQPAEELPNHSIVDTATQPSAEPATELLVDTAEHPHIRPAADPSNDTVNQPADDSANEALVHQTEEPPSQTAKDPVSEPATDPVPPESTEQPKSTDHPSVDDIGGTARKKRRRIVQLNDDDDSDDEDNALDRLELLRSPEPMNEPESGEIADPHEGTERPVNDEDGNDDAHEKDDGSDRPDSAASDRGAASILQNVVMIPAGDSEAHKRKKIRVLDSDDDEEEQRVADSVDDIGLTGDGEGDEFEPGGLLMDENAEDGDYGAMEGIEMDKMEQIVTMDAPIIDQSRMINEDGDEDDDDNGEETAGSKHGDSSREDSEHEEQDNQGSEAESDHHDAVEEESVEDELGEEEEVVEEGVEMITAENEEGEAIGIATDDENGMDENQEEEENRSDSEPEREEGHSDNQGSDKEDEDNSQEAARSDAEVSQQEERSDAENDNKNDQSESRSADSPAGPEKESPDSTSGQEKEETTANKSDSEDDVVCQNDLELNTISLLTDEEDDNPTPLPPPKKELPVVRIVNIKKELLDDRIVKRQDAAASYQQQHYLKQQQLAQRKHEKKRKKERTFDNNDPFGAWSSSSSDDEFIPNDIYFGTPDRVYTVSTKIRCQRQKMINDRYSKFGKTGKTGKRRYSDDSDAEERRKRKQKLEQVARLNLPSYQQQQLQNLIKRKKKRKHDRFYDKSQDIPNDIYFGNVNVPLHILYAFGSSSSEDERVERGRYNNVWKTTPATTSKPSKYYSSSKSSRSATSSSYSRSSLSPSNDRSVQAMKEYLKIAGFKNVKFHKLWEGCKSNQERANAILRLMQEKGLEGEPTIAKCRELRKQLQMEREAKVLDTSLIIDSGEGRITRRSVRNPQNQPPGDPADPNAPSTSGLAQPPALPPVGLETLNRIRNVVDPDSDGE